MLVVQVADAYHKTPTNVQIVRILYVTNGLEATF